MSDWACAYCGKTKPPAAFPNSTYARCWQCTWDQHVKEVHPLPRSERRALRKFARNFAHSKAVREAQDRLAVINLPLPPVPVAVDPTTPEDGKGATDE